MDKEGFDVLVIMPTHRRAHILPEAIESVLGQPGARICLIVVDDDPAGSAAPAAARYREAGVIYLQTPTPSGGRPGAVRNHAFQISQAMGIRARFVHFLDDDDMAAQGLYARAIAAFEAHPEAGVVFGEIRSFCCFAADPAYQARQRQQFADDFRWRANAARVARAYLRVGEATGWPGLTRWLFQMQARYGPEMFLCSGGLVRHEHVVALDGYQSDFYLMEDYEFFTRAIRRFGVHFMNAVSAHYRLATSDSLWGPVEIEQDKTQERSRRILDALRTRQHAIRVEVGALDFYLGKAVYRLLVKPVFYNLRALDALRPVGKRDSTRLEAALALQPQAG